MGVLFPMSGHAPANDSGNQNQAKRVGDAWEGEGGLVLLASPFEDSGTCHPTPFCPIFILGVPTRPYFASLHLLALPWYTVSVSGCVNRGLKICQRDG